MLVTEFIARAILVYFPQCDADIHVLLLYCQCARVCCCNIANVRGCVVAVVPMSAGVWLLYYQCARVCYCCITNVRGYVVAV